VDPALQRFYERLLAVLRHPAVRNGEWRLLECRPAWDGNWTWDSFIVWLWAGEGGRRLVAVNYSAHQSQCYVRIMLPDRDAGTVRLTDLLSPAIFDRDGRDLDERGLYLDLPPWGYHVFDLRAA
jgi:hypothetical protein